MLCSTTSMVFDVLHVVQVAYADIQESDGSLLGYGIETGSKELSAAHFVRCDAGHAGQIEAAVKKTIETLGGLDVLVNNVGAHAQPAGLPCHEMSVESWDQVLGINLRSHFLFSKFALREAFMPQRSGCIVNIGSVHAFQNAPGVPAYAAAKGGVVSLTRQLAVEYAPHGIRVTCVVPGTINTPMVCPNKCDLIVVGSNKSSGSVLHLYLHPYLCTHLHICSYIRIAYEI